MKKVCLVTYTGSPNYGAALQLFATYEALKSIGCDVSVINYQNEFESEKSGIKFLLSHASIKEKAREYISSYLFGVKKNSYVNFHAFYNEMKFTNPVRSISQINELEEFDVFCVGSDQVWNPKITDGFDDVFILNFEGIKKKISYASSMGSCDIGGYSEKTFIDSLGKFDYISVREAVACEYLENRLSVPIKQVVDPTFLIDRDEWEKYLRSHSNIKSNEKYVLIYALGGYFEDNRRVAQQIAKKIDAKVYAITLSNRNKSVDKIITDATPFDFVRYIRDASFVVTNSFHGTCFSVIMNTPFYSVRFGDNPARAEELLNMCKIQRRLLKRNETVNEEFLDNKDIINANSIMKQKTLDSVEWLKRAIYG